MCYNIHYKSTTMPFILFIGTLLGLYGYEVTITKNWLKYIGFGGK